MFMCLSIDSSYRFNLKCFLRFYTINLIMRLVGIFDKYTGEVFKLFGVEVNYCDPNDSNLDSVVENLLKKFIEDKSIFSVIISKNISSRTRNVVGNFVLTHDIPFIVEVDPAMVFESYESYETIIRKMVRETIGIRI